jgi:hypothetical protein
MIDIVSTFRSYALSQDGSQRPPNEVIPVRVSLLLEAAAEIERLKAAIEAAIVDLTNNQRLQAHRKLARALSGDKHE